jgi:hypothetical protein
MVLPTNKPNHCYIVQQAGVVTCNQMPGGITGENGLNVRNLEILLQMLY